MRTFSLFQSQITRWYELQAQVRKQVATATCPLLHSLLQPNFIILMWICQEWSEPERAIRLKKCIKMVSYITIQNCNLKASHWKALSSFEQLCDPDIGISKQEMWDKHASMRDSFCWWIVNTPLQSLISHVF